MTSTPASISLPVFSGCSPPQPNTPMRTWSRFENRCIRCNVRPSSFVNPNYIPIMCTQNPSNEDLDMRRKAEILQYRNNDGKLTKKQKWSRMVKGHGPGGKTSWATQTVNYTDPNIRKLYKSSQFTLLCNSVPVKCALPTDNNVPGNGPPICFEKDVPLTRYIVRRTYPSGGTKWPEIKWSPGDNGFPNGKSGSSSSTIIDIDSTIPSNTPSNAPSPGERPRNATKSTC